MPSLFFVIFSLGKKMLFQPMPEVRVKSDNIKWQRRFGANIADRIFIGFMD